MRLFGRLTDAVRDGQALVIEALVDAAGIAPAVLLKAVKKLAGARVGQMHADPAGGYLIGADVRNGMIWLKARLTDSIAVIKAAQMVYAGLSIEAEETGKGGLRINEVSLVDTPVEKRAGAGEYAVLCKIFERPRDMNKREMRERSAAVFAAADRAADTVKKAEALRAAESEAWFRQSREQLEGGDAATVEKRRQEDAARGAGPPITGEQACLDQLRAQRAQATALAKRPATRGAFENFLISRAGR